MKSSLEGNKQQIFSPIYFLSILPLFFFFLKGKNKLAQKGELICLGKKDFFNLRHVWPLFSDLFKKQRMKPKYFLRKYSIELF